MKCRRKQQCQAFLNRNRIPSKDLPSSFAEDCREAWAFHAALPGYAPTPLVSLPSLASWLGIGQLRLKDESRRFGLNAFKELGASFAVERCLQGKSGRLTFCTATDGNHGRAVAWAARRLGHGANVFMPAHSVPARIEAVRAEGAEVTVIDGDYDAAVRAAEARARESGGILLQDMAWQGYSEIPRWIMAGYTTILQEIENTVLASKSPGFDAVFLQAGVGSWAAAAAAFYRSRCGSSTPRLVIVEPLEADCLLESARKGRLCSSSGKGGTIMAGLNCGTPSSIAWEILRVDTDIFLAIPDEFTVEAMRALYHPAGSDPGVVAGESGAAGLGGLMAVLKAPELAEAREHLRLDSSARVLVVNTEGDTDPDGFRAIVNGAVE
jgi:diaminopropionate ammonia-lyase